MHDRPTSRMLLLLASERAALRKGEIEKALALSAEKEKLFTALTMPLSSEALTELRKAAAHNCRLLQAALNGWEEATGRRNALSQQAKTFQHYQADGTGIRSMPAGGAVFEKRS